MDRQIKIDKCYGVDIDNWEYLDLPEGVKTKVDLYNWYRYLPDNKLDKIYKKYFG